MAGRPRACAEAEATFGRVTDRFRMRRRGDERDRGDETSRTEEARPARQPQRETIAQSGRLIRLGSRGQF